jgi:hypothetical protein
MPTLVGKALQRPLEQHVRMTRSDWVGGKRLESPLGMMDRLA